MESKYVTSSPVNVIRRAKLTGEGPAKRENLAETMK